MEERERERERERESGIERNRKVKENWREIRKMEVEIEKKRGRS